MQFFFDTEFIEDGKTIDLISIGIKSGDNYEYYAESSEVDWSKASPWVLENVKPYLKGGEFLKTRKQIASDILSFVGAEPKFWAYYAAYDWVVLCQLYGTMMDLPKGWPMYCHDLKQLIQKFPYIRPTNEHNALEDARAVKATYEAFIQYEAELCFPYKTVREALAPIPDVIVQRYEEPHNAKVN